MSMKKFWIPDEIEEHCGYIRTGKEYACDKCIFVIRKEDCKTRADIERLEREENENR